MPTVPTGEAEDLLRSLWLRWCDGIPAHENDLDEYANLFIRQARDLIESAGEGMLPYSVPGLDFPPPEPLNIPLDTGTFENQLKKVLIESGIAAGVGARDVARGMREAGLQRSWGHLEMTARTHMVRAHWERQWQGCERFVADGRLQMVWMAEQGPRTCPCCLAKNGMVVTERGIVDHPGGRCTLVPRLAQIHDPSHIVNAPAGRDPDWLQDRDPLMDGTIFQTFPGISPQDGTILADALGHDLRAGLNNSPVLQRQLCAICGEGKTITDARRDLLAGLNLSEDFRATKHFNSEMNRLLATRANSLWREMTPNVPKILYRGGSTNNHMAAWTTNKRDAIAYAKKHDIMNPAVATGNPAGCRGYPLDTSGKEWLIRGAFMPQNRPGPAIGYLAG